MRYFDDINVGDRMELGTHTFTAEDIKTFAAQYDPQAFHMDEAAAAKSHFGALCASGWHTIAAWMRLRVLYGRREDAERAARGEVIAKLGPSPGFRELKWLKPVYVGDTITYASEIVEKRVTKSRPGWGIVFARKHRDQPERRAGAVVHRLGVRRAAAGSRMSAATDTSPADAARRDERRAMGVAGGAHALHDGYTDLIYVMLPIWQAEFGLSYAAIGALRGAVRRHHGGLSNPGRFAERAARRAAGARGRHRARGTRLLPCAARRSYPALIAILLIAGARCEHAASARLRAGRARVCRAAFARRARHLQFRRRSRQDGACRPRPRCWWW